LKTVIVHGAIKERVRYSDPEKGSPHFPASWILHTIGQFNGSVFSNKTSASRVIFYGANLLFRKTSSSSPGISLGH
jgi:hypothetical protein